MEVEYIEIKYLDDCMTKFLQLYAEDGTSSTYGALLAKSFPASRLVFNPSTTRMPENPPTAAATIFSASAVPNIPGVYILTAQIENRPFESWKELRHDNSRLPDITHLQFLNTLKSGEPFGTRFKHVRLIQFNLRREFDLIRWPFRMRDPALKFAAATAAYPDLRSSTIIVLAGASPFKVHTAEANLHLVYYHHKGSPIQWIVVPPQGKLLFESKLRALSNLNDQPYCSQFVSHMDIWIRPGLLRAWGVCHYEMQQKSGQMFFVFPGSYVWGYSLGFAIIEQRNLGGNNWKIRQESLCSMNTDACRVANPYGLPYQLSQENYDAIERASFSLAATPIKKRKRDQPASLQQIPPQDLASPLANMDLDNDQMHCQNPSLMSNDDFSMSDGDEGFSSLTPVDQDDDNSVLRDHLHTLLVERQYQRIRKEDYKERLLEREEYINHLELKVQELEPFKELRNILDQRGEAPTNGEVQPSPWKEVAMKAYRVTVERDRRIKELEENVRAVAPEKGRLTKGFEQKLQRVIVQNEKRIDELVNRLHGDATQSNFRINELTTEADRIIEEKNRRIRELEGNIKALSGAAGLL